MDVEGVGAEHRSKAARGDRAPYQGPAGGAWVSVWDGGMNFEGCGCRAKKKDLYIAHEGMAHLIKALLGGEYGLQESGFSRKVWTRKVSHML